LKTAGPPGAERAKQLENSRAARREAFAAQHQAYFDSVIKVCGVGSRAHDIIVTAQRLAELTTNQREALDSMVAEVQRKQTSQHVGTVGERREFTCKLVRFFDWSKPGQFGRTFYKYCHIMHDENGQVIKYIGSVILGGVKWEGEYGDKYPVVDETVTLRFVATIEGHEDYKGEKQTIVARPKIKE